MNIKKISIIGVSIAVCIGLFILGYYARGFYDKRQQTVANKVAISFVNDVLAGKTDDAYSLTASSLQAKKKVEDFKKDVGDLKADKPVFLPAIFYVKDGTGYYIQTVGNMPKSNSGSTSAAFALTLTKSGTSWKVATVSVQ